MVNYKFNVGDKVKIPKSKTTGYKHDNYSTFIEILNIKRYLLDYLIIKEVQSNNFYKTELESMSGYFPIFSIADLELYEENLIHELW